MIVRFSSAFLLWCALTSSSWAESRYSARTGIALAVNSVAAKADVAPCGDDASVDTLKSIVAEAMTKALLLSSLGYAQKLTAAELSISGMYTTSSTDNVRHCNAEITYNKNGEQKASAEIAYDIIVTDDGKTFTKWNEEAGNWALFSRVILSDKMPTSDNQAMKDFLAPQGPGSPAARARERNRDN